jgi:septal ring factor EnvC (AmiA/AmiB activator)
MDKIIKSILVASLLGGGLILSSCSNSPSDEELKQLSDLKAEVSSLESQVVNKTKEKSTLQKQIDEKNAKLQQCQSDQEAVKKGLGK